MHIRLNSYGGSCNAAVRMFDDVRAYPGSVRITVSGTAASAATVLAMAADRLEMTPGSLWMIHDPSVVAWGNERELMDSIRLLQACKESILNVYQRRCQTEPPGGGRHDERHMRGWTRSPRCSTDSSTPSPKTASLARRRTPGSAGRIWTFAKAKVQAWQDRHKPRLTRAEKQETADEAHPSMALPDDEQTAVYWQRMGECRGKRRRCYPAGTFRHSRDPAAEDGWVCSCPPAGDMSISDSNEQSQ